MNEHFPGARIVTASWMCTGAFALTSIPVALGVGVLRVAGLVVALAFFALSIPVWMLAFGRALRRNAQGDDIVVASLFWLRTSAPPPVRLRLLGSLGVSIVLAFATAAAQPFGTLVPMLPLGLVGLWGARWGSFPKRPTVG